MTLIKIFIFILGVSFLTSTAYAVPKSITFQTRIMQPNLAALEAPAVQFRITTLDPLGACVLYVENFNSVSMTNSGGFVILNLGLGAPSFSAIGSDFVDVFNNGSGTLTCQSGGTYTPSINDRRKLVMQFNDGSGSGWQTSPSIEINSVPFSNFAGDAVKLAGRPVTDFTLKASFPDCNTAGKVLTFNGTNFSCVSPSAGSGTVTNVTSANSYLTIATGTTTPVLTANVGTAANTLAAGNDTRITGAAQKANNLSDLASAATARTNLGSTTVGDALFTTASATAARTTLGLGNASLLDAGTAATNLVQLDGTAKIPAALLPSSAITSSTSLVGDVTGTIGATVVSTVGTKTAAQVAQSVADTTAATNANTASTIVKRDGSGNIATTSLSSTNLSTQNTYLYDAANTNKILLKAPTTGITDYSLILPPVVGTANQIIGYNAAANALENKSITAGTGVSVTHTAGGIQIAATGSGGTVTSVTSANTDIAVATTTSTPVLTLNVGTGNNQIVKLDGSAKLPAVDGSALTNLTAANLASAVPITKGGTGATTAAAALNNLLPTQTSNGGKFLQTDGSAASWVSGNAGTVTSVTSANSYLTIATTTSTPVITAVVGTAANTLAAGDDSRITGSVQQTAYNGDIANVLDTNCGVGSTPKWNVSTDMWTCVAIGSLPASAITSGTIAVARLGTGTGSSSNYLRGDGAWTALTSSQWTTATNDIYYTTGKVGIGTTTPGNTLEVTGAAASSGLRFTNLNSSSTKVANNNTLLALNATGDVQLSSPTLPFYNINGTTSSNSVARDYNSIAALGTNIGISDVLGSMSNGPANLGWFAAVYTLANSSTNPYTSQLTISDLGAAFRGGQTSSINSAVWQKFLTLPAANNFSVTNSSSDIKLTNADNGALSFLTNNLERVKILNTGYVGINTSTPAGILDVQGGTAASGNGTNINIVAQSGFTTGVTNGGNINLTAGSANSTGVPGVVNVNPSGIALVGGTGAGGANPAAAGFTGIYASGANRIDFGTNGVNRVSILANGNVVLGSLTSSVVANNFYDYGTNTNGFAMDISGSYIKTSSTKRITVDNSGNVGIGLTPTTYKLDVAGDTNIASTSALRFGGTSVCTSTGCTTSSDRRLKENITPLTDSLNQILQVQGVQYDYRDKEKFGDKHQIGVIAQDVEKIFPEVVRTDEKTGLKSVAYDHLVAPLIEAFKQLHARLVNVEKAHVEVQRGLASNDQLIEILKNENETKDKKIKQLEQRLDRMEKILLHQSK